MQQVFSSNTLHASVAPQTDFIVQALVMACIVELLFQNHMSAVSWTLTVPPVIISIIILFYFVLHNCSL
jgi:hypothetical protein